MEDVLIPLSRLLDLFIGLPWLVFHYVTKWKQTATSPVPTKSFSTNCMTWPAVSTTASARSSGS